MSERPELYQQIIDLEQDVVQVLKADILARQVDGVWEVIPGDTISIAVDQLEQGQELISRGPFTCLIAVVGDPKIGYTLSHQTHPGPPIIIDDKGKTDDLVDDDVFNFALTTLTDCQKAFKAKFSSKPKKTYLLGLGCLPVYQARRLKAKISCHLSRPAKEKNQPMILLSGWEVLIVFLFPRLALPSKLIKLPMPSS